MFVDVALPLPLEGFFTYTVPEDMRDAVKTGMRAVVPLGKSKTYVGVVVEIHDRKPDFETRDIIDLPDSKPLVTDSQLKLWKWVADYYMSMWLLGCCNGRRSSRKCLPTTLHSRITTAWRAMCARKG